MLVAAAAAMHLTSLHDERQRLVRQKLEGCGAPRLVLYSLRLRPTSLPRGDEACAALPLR